MMTTYLNVDGGSKPINTLELEPAPASDLNDILKLQHMLSNADENIFFRYQALVKLKKIGTLESAKAIFAASDTIVRHNTNDSELLMHDCVYILGQFQIEESIGLLIMLLQEGGHAVV